MNMLVHIHKKGVVVKRLFCTICTVLFLVAPVSGIQRIRDGLWLDSTIMAVKLGTPGGVVLAQNGNGILSSTTSLTASSGLSSIKIDTVWGLVELKTPVASSVLKTGADSNIVGCTYLVDDEDLGSVAALTGTGSVFRINSSTWVERILTAGTGISITDGDGVSGNPIITLDHLSFEDLTDPNADRIVFWDDGSSKTEWLSLGTGISISGTSLELAAILQTLASLANAGGLLRNNGAGTLSWSNTIAYADSAELSHHAVEADSADVAAKVTGSMTSAEFAAVCSDETGTAGALMFSQTPTVDDTLIVNGEGGNIYIGSPIAGAHIGPVGASQPFTITSGSGAVISVVPGGGETNFTGTITGDSLNITNGAVFGGHVTGSIDSSINAHHAVEADSAGKAYHGVGAGFIPKSATTSTWTASLLEETADKFIRLNSAADTAGFRIYNAGTGDTIVQLWDNNGGGVSGGNGELMLYGSGGTKKIFLTADGNSYIAGGDLAIGTNEPIHPFDCRGDAWFGDYVNVTSFVRCSSYVWVKDSITCDTLKANGAQLINLTLATQAITDNAVLTVDDADAADDDYAKLTANGLEGRSYAEVRSDINVEDGADVTDATNVDAAGAVMESDIGITDDDILQVDGSPNSGEYARFTASGIEGTLHFIGDSLNMNDNLAISRGGTIRLIGGTYRVHSTSSLYLSSDTCISNAAEIRSGSINMVGRNSGVSIVFKKLDGTIYGAIGISDSNYVIQNSLATSMKLINNSHEAIVISSDGSVTTAGTWTITDINLSTQNISDNDILTVDGSPNDDEAAVFTADGAEGLTEAEFKILFNMEAGIDYQAYNATLDILSGKDSTGTGNVVLDNTPTLVTPVIGAATGTSLDISGGDLTATNANLSALTDNYVIKHISDAAGLGNSVIYDDGTNIIIGGTSPQSGYELTVNDDIYARGNIVAAVNLYGASVNVSATPIATGAGFVQSTFADNTILTHSASTANAGMFLSHNTYLSTGWEWKRIIEDQACGFGITDGDFTWSADDSAAAGVAYNPTMRMRLVKDSGLVIGASTDPAQDGYKLAVYDDIYADGHIHAVSYFDGTERSSDPSEPAEGKYVIWMSDGTGKGDDGDVLIASKAGGTTKWTTLFDHSAGGAW